jgi:hypothetical protein
MRSRVTRPTARLFIETRPPVVRDNCPFSAFDCTTDCTKRAVSRADFARSGVFCHVGRIGARNGEERARNLSWHFARELWLEEYPSSHDETQRFEMKSRSSAVITALEPPSRFESGRPAEVSKRPTAPRPLKSLVFLCRRNRWNRSPKHAEPKFPKASPWFGAKRNQLMLATKGPKRQGAILCRGHQRPRGERQETKPKELPVI